jgi:ABC-type branched-subunit amino acid transport system substrate-binding protein
MKRASQWRTGVAMSIALLVSATSAVFSLLPVSSHPDRHAFQVQESTRLAAAPEQPSGPVGNIGVTNSEIVIGSCLPLTGKLDWKGKIISKTAEAYFDSVNEKGGINGRKIKFITCDDGYDPEKAVTCFNTCLKDKVFLGCFFNGSAAIAKYIRMAEINKLPLFGFLVGPNLVYDLHPYQFTLRPSYAQETERLIKELYEVHNVHKVGLIYQSDVMGASIRESVIKELNKYHTAPIAEASFSRDLNDPQTGLDLVEKSKPEVIILGVSSAGIPATIAWRTASKCKSLCVTLSPMDDALRRQGKNSDGVVITEIAPPPESTQSGVQRYRQLVSQRIPGEEPNFLGLEVFMNAEVLCEALKLAGPSLTREKFTQAMESLHEFDLGAGPKYKVSFNVHKHVGLDPSAIYFAQIQGGKVVPASEQDITKLVEQARAAAK